MKRLLIPTTRATAPTPYAAAEHALRTACRTVGVTPDAHTTIFASDFHQPIVYAWMRGEACRYVGTSAHGLTRLYGNHEVVRNLGPDDVIFVWHVSAHDARWLEERLIKALRPALNVTGNPDRWAAARRRAEPKVSHLEVFEEGKV